MITSCGVATIPGLNHRYNEDRYRILGGDVPAVCRADRGHLYAVMDGVGSALKGMTTAQLLADSLTLIFTAPDLPGAPDQLCSIIERANLEAYNWGLDPSSGRRLAGAAFTLAWFAPEGRVHVFQCGDTGAFRFDGDGLTRLTNEHVNSAGELTQYLGQGTEFRMDAREVSLEEGDILCLVSDGVTKALDADALAAVLATNASLPTLADRVCSLARSRGSADDITCVVVELEEW